MFPYYHQVLRSLRRENEGVHGLKDQDQLEKVNKKEGRRERMTKCLIGRGSRNFIMIIAKNRKDFNSDTGHLDMDKCILYLTRSQCTRKNATLSSHSLVRSLIGLPNFSIEIKKWIKSNTRHLHITSAGRCKRTWQHRPSVVHLHMNMLSSN